MIEFYNAFISYKHAKLDSEIAERVQKKLEHFHVPHNLKKKIRHQKITRIFRDKDELPITSDLTETITDALEKAEYLIVICSTNTKESIWVKREINTFLKTHTKDQVLTVLCDGEPEDVIPEELLTEVKEYVDANGILHRISVPKEPLSCDYRMKKSKADKEELPRLASALLGCSYDELQRRRRQYRIRRAAIVVAAVFAALVAFGSYMSYSWKKIDDSYIESLRSRSMYLANESRQLLEEGKRADAVLLALAALPQDANDKMPETAQAVRAITDATGAYECSKGSLYYEATWNYKANNVLLDAIQSDEKTYLAAVDRTGIVYCWDMRTRQELFEVAADKNPLNIMFLGEESLLVVLSDRLEAYNIQTGSLVWKYEFNTSFTRKSAVRYAANGIYFDDTQGNVVKLSARDGSVQATYAVKEAAYFTSIDYLAVSPDGTKIAFTDGTYVYGEDPTISIYDTETGTKNSDYIDAYVIYEIKFIDNEHVFVIGNKDSLTASSDFGDALSYLREGYKNFYCFDSSMNLLWENELVFTDVSAGYDLYYLPSRNAVVLFVGNTATICDVTTGEISNTYRTGTSIITVDDWNNNGLPEFVCKGGEYLLAIKEDANDMASIKVTDYEIDLGLIGETLLYIPEDGSDIIAYDHYFRDNGFDFVDNDYIVGSSFYASCCTDEYLVIASRISETSDMRVTIVDPYTGELLFTEDVSDVSLYVTNFGIEYLGDCFYIYGGDDIYEVDPYSERIKVIDYETDWSDDISHGKIISCDTTETEMTLEVYDIADDHSDYLTEDGFKGLDWTMLGYCYYVPEIDTVFVPMGNRIFAADLEEEEITEIDLPDTWEEEQFYNFYATASEDGSKIVLTDGSNVLVTDDSYNELFVTRCSYSRRFGVEFHDGIMYLVEDNYLYRYDEETGDVLGKYLVTIYGTGEVSFFFEDETNSLFIQGNEQICIFDTNEWIETANILDAYCYHPGSQKFFMFTFERTGVCYIGYIKRYTTEELIEKGKEFLNGRELDDLTRNKYGL